MDWEVKLIKHVFSGNFKKEDKYVSINVKPGWKSGTKVTFQKEGDQIPGKVPADIVFILRDKPHALYRREGSDVRFTARITLKQVRVASLFLPLPYSLSISLNFSLSAILSSHLKKLS